MKKLQLMTLAMLFSICGHSTIFVTSNQSWSPQTVSQDIVIEPGYSLNIGGALIIDGPYRILVKNGAQLRSDNGSISAPANGYWKGIEVEPTLANNPNLNKAIDLENFQISRALAAIRMLPDFDIPYDGDDNIINQKVYVENTTFIDNLGHHVTTSSSNSLSISIGSQNLLYGVNDIIFHNCDFLAMPQVLPNLEYWGVHFRFYKNIRFTECTFDDPSGNSNFGINFEDVKDVFIGGSTFREHENAAISIQGINENITIVANSFLGSNNDGIVLGCWSFLPTANSQSILTNGNFSSNYFGALESSATAICLGNTIRKGYGQEITIVDNNITGYNVGINAWDLLGIVDDNIFSSYAIGTRILNNASNLSMNCNIFKVGNIGLSIEVNGSLQDWTNLPYHWNRFTGATVDIRNNSSNPFSVYSSNLGPVTTIGNVNITNLESDGDSPCINNPALFATKSQQSLSVNETSNISVFKIYPNPTNNGQIKILYKNADHATYSISDLSGRIIRYQIPVDGNGEDQINLNELSSGTYIISFMQSGYTETTRLIIH